MTDCACARLALAKCIVDVAIEFQEFKRVRLVRWLLVACVLAD